MGDVNLEWYGWPNRPCDTKCSDDCPSREGCQIYREWRDRYAQEFGQAAADHYQYPHDPDRNERVKFEAGERELADARRRAQVRLREAVIVVADAAGVSVAHVWSWIRGKAPEQKGLGAFSRKYSRAEEAAQVLAEWAGVERAQVITWVKDGRRTNKELGAAYGVSESRVERIRAHTTWRHLWAT